jgi:hypothetical protein
LCKRDSEDQHFREEKEIAINMNGIKEFVATLTSDSTEDNQKANAHHH